MQLVECEFHLWNICINTSFFAKCQSYPGQDSDSLRPNCTTVQAWRAGESPFLHLRLWWCSGPNWWGQCSGTPFDDVLLGGLHLHELLLLRFDLCEITRISSSRPGPESSWHGMSPGSVSLVEKNACIMQPNMNRQVMPATKHEAIIWNVLCVQ